VAEGKFEHTAFQHLCVVYTGGTRFCIFQRLL